MFNTEYVPAENLGSKNASWDRKDGYFVPRDCYNSYFFRVEDSELSIVDKMIMHGEEVVKYFDGGSACHLNLDEHLTKEQYRKLLMFLQKLVVLILRLIFQIQFVINVVIFQNII